MLSDVAPGEYTFVALPLRLAGADSSPVRCAGRVLVRVTVPIVIPWDLYEGKLVVWCEAVAAGARRAVLLPRLDTIFAPVQEDPAREREYVALDWRLVSPREADWTRTRRW